MKKASIIILLLVSFSSFITFALQQETYEYIALNNQSIFDALGVQPNASDKELQIAFDTFKKARFAPLESRFNDLSNYILQKNDRSTEVKAKHYAYQGMLQTVKKYMQLIEGIIYNKSLKQNYINELKNIASKESANKAARIAKIKELNKKFLEDIEDADEFVIIER